MPQAEVGDECGAEPPNVLNDILLALGSNRTSTVGSPIVTIRKALLELEKYGAVIRTASPLYSTPAFPAGNGPDFVNAAARIAAPWSLSETLEICHKIEAAMGRERAKRWGQRTLDIDLIACGDLVLPDVETHRIWRELPLNTQMERTPDRLILPHPRLQERAFVLVPLADVAPDWVHPVLGQSVLQMRDALEQGAIKEVRRIE